MAHLSGPPESFLELTPLRYQFPDIAAERTRLARRTAHDPWRGRVVFDRTDANWLFVHLAASDGIRRWSADDAAFLTWELRDLVSWLRDLTIGRQTNRVFGGIEQSLQFEANGTAERIRLRALFQSRFHPGRTYPEIRHDDCSINFDPGAGGLGRFADELEQELRPFPLREVE